MHKVLVGADPELFMLNPNNGQFISAHGRIPGTKYEPFKVPNGAIQVDGTALEFNIDPASTVEQFVSNIKSVRATLEGYVPGFNVVAQPVANFDQEYWIVQVPPEAQALGCDPDFNGWTKAQNPSPNPEGKPMRTASGHVHIGWTQDVDVFDKDHYELCCKMARQMDYYLGIQSLLWDKDGTRRSLYGKAGAFRPKPYGVEYRVLSNRWLDNDKLIAWVYNSIQVGMEAAFNDCWAEKQYGKLGQHIIDNNITNWQKCFDIKVDGLPELPLEALSVGKQYDNLDDVKSKLVGTIIYKDGAPVHCKGAIVNEEKGSFLLQLSDTFLGRKHNFVDMLDPSLNWMRYNLGYCNYDTVAVWWYRKPLRQYRQGLRHDQMAYKANEKMPDYGGFTFSTNVPVEQMLMDKYPSVHDIEKRLKDKDAQILAFHRDLACSWDEIHKDMIIEHKGRMIGCMTSNMHDFKLADDYQYLYETVKEAVGAL